MPWCFLRLAPFFEHGRRDAFELVDLFAQRRLAPDATAGRLGLVLRFGESTPDGTAVDLSVQLADGAGLRSNCYTLSLDIAVGPP